MHRGRRGRWFWAIVLACVQSSMVKSAPTEPRSGPSKDQTTSSTARAAAGPSTLVPDVNPLPSDSSAGTLGLGAPAAPLGTEGAHIFGQPAAEEVLRGLPINLASALQLAGVSPLDIAAATVQVQQGLAVLLQAKVLWVPTLNAGVDYYRHDGVQQNFFTGGLFQKGLQKLFVGGGPSLSVGVTDAVYEPLAARRVVAAREANLQTARNDVLLQVSQAYFTLQDARGRLVGVDATIERARRLVNFTIGLAPALIAPLEINRAQAELQSLLQSREIALRDWQVASAALANILLLDPETLLEPVEPPFVQVTLIAAEQTVADLVPIAINSRPEIASQRELLAAANMRLKQEKKRPFLPNLILTSPATGTGLLAAGNLSGGPNAGLGANAHSAFFEVAAVWQLQNGGIGNIGLIRQRRAEQDLAAIEVTRTLFRVRADVTQALARLQTARARVPVTEMGLWQATESADKNFIGLRETTRPAGALLNLIVRPQEVVAALIALNTAFEQYSAAVNDYNAAQFELYRAVGQPAQWVTSQASQLPLIARDAKPTQSPAAGPNAPAAPDGAVRP
jgi:outer membrane protein TolC